PAPVTTLLGVPPLAAAIIRFAVKHASPKRVVDLLQGLAKSGLLGKLWWQVDDILDPNDRRHAAGIEGLCYTPLSTNGHRRVGTRDRLLDVAARRPDRLRIELDALATRVLFDGDRAVGIAYLKGERLYRADTAPSGAAGEAREIRAAREVILAGGAFNT